MNQRIINYIGAIGRQNLGDEALYKSIQKIFDMYHFIPHPLYMYDQGYPRSGIVIVGGGTILPADVTTVRPGRYNYVFGAGVKNPIFWGNMLSDEVVLRRLESFDFRFIGVRGNISRDLLKDWGFASEVIGDPCLSLDTHHHIERDTKKIAISIGSDGVLWGQDEEKILHAIAKVCRALKKDGYHPILIPFWGGNIELINKVSNAEKVDVFNNWFNIQAVLNLIASCKVLIGERLHSLVFSASVFTPFVCLEYRPKCFEFSESVGFAGYTIRTDKITGEKIMTMFEDLINNWNQMHSRLVEKVKTYRKKQREFAARMIADIESLPDDKWATPSLLGKIKGRIFWDTDMFLHEKMANVWRVYNRLVFLRILPYLI